MIDPFETIPGKEGDSLYNSSLPIDILRSKNASLFVWERIVDEGIIRACDSAYQSRTSHLNYLVFGVKKSINISEKLEASDSKNS